MPDATDVMHCGKQGCDKPGTVRGYSGTLFCWACEEHASELTDLMGNPLGYGSPTKQVAANTAAENASELERLRGLVRELENDARQVAPDRDCVEHPRVSIDSRFIHWLKLNTGDK